MNMRCSGSMAAGKPIDCRTVAHNILATKKHAVSTVAVSLSENCAWVGFFNRPPVQTLLCG
jgi:hypothetical protein